MMLKLGTAKRDITKYEIGKGMMGYGMHFHIVKGVMTPISVRVFVVISSSHKIAFIVAELCFITIALKDALLKALNQQLPDSGWNDSNIVFSAQHTHNAPGGLSHYILYNLTIPGFRKKIFEHIISQTTAAIKEAENTAITGELYFAKDHFDPSIPVAFNRSLQAYNRNPDVEKRTKLEWHLAVHRTMNMLRFEGINGRSIGSINWFGVHTTSISNDNMFIHFDNKGYAAKFFEEYKAQEGNLSFVAAFAQERCGDVSPNYIWDTNKKWMRGTYENDNDSAKENGKHQFDLAKSIYERSLENKPLSTYMDSHLIYVDMGKVEIDPDFAGGMSDQQTSPATHGVSFLEGTKEGPGLPRIGGFFMNLTSSLIRFYEMILLRPFVTKGRRAAILRKYKAQKRKKIMVEAGEGRLAGTTNIKKLILPGAVDPTIQTFKKLDEAGYTKRLPWIPQVLPLQIIIIDHIAWLCFAAEITVVAGKRLAESTLEILKKKGITEIILAPYSNGYHGYITTREEYNAGAYEGGHTVFGEWTLAAYQMWFKKLAEELLLPPEKRLSQKDVKPDIFNADEIWYGFDEPQNGNTH